MEIDLKGISAEKRLFHNEWVDVYPKDLKFEEIKYWPQNYRTVLDFDVLAKQKKKSIDELTVPEITDFLVHRHDLYLYDLAESIRKNGVRVPLIIADDGTLLDGNRRYFACSYLYQDAKNKNETVPRVLEKIPALIIKSKDINERLKQKILAEANFVSDFKVPWTLDVKAKVISDYFDSCLNKGLSKEKAYEEIQDIYGVSKSDVEAYVEAIALTKDFIANAKDDKKNQFREIVQGKFVYFWEFRNKGLKGRAPLDPRSELPQVKQLFFKMLENQRFSNLKQVEPMIRAVRDKDRWEILSESQGVKIDVIEAFYKEDKAVRSAEDKIRNFQKWISEKADPLAFSKAAFNQLEQLQSSITSLLEKFK